MLSPARTGIDFVQPIDTRHPLKFLYIGGYASSGVAISDVDGNGLQDVFFTGETGQEQVVPPGREGRLGG